MIELTQCDICTKFASLYRGCDRCSGILCTNCAHDSEGIYFCRECYAKYEEEQKRIEEEE